MLSEAIVIFDPIFYLASGLAVTCLGLSKSGFVGFGLIATPLLALVVPPAQAVAILLPIMLLQDIISVWAYRHDWDKWNLTVLLPSAALGVVLAWFVAGSVSDSDIRLAVGFIAFGYAVFHSLVYPPIKSKRRPVAMYGIVLGAVAGFTGTLANAAGPPFLLFVLPQQLEKLTFVGTMAIFFTVLNGIKVIPFFALGQFSTQNVATSIMLLPLAVAANFLGIWLVGKMPVRLFYKVAYVLMFFISVALLWQGSIGASRG